MSGGATEPQSLPWPVYRPCACCNFQCAWLAPTCPYVPVKP